MSVASKWMPNLIGWTAVLGLLVPVIQTFWVSFSPDSLMTVPTDHWSLIWYQAFVADRRWTAASVRSLAIASCASAGCVIVIAPAVVAIHRAFPRKHHILIQLLMLPAVLPSAALGTGLLPMMHVTHLWGTNVGMVLVHLTLGLPIAYLIISSSLTSELRDLEFAASGLGASPWQVIWRVTRPQLSSGFFAGAIAVFVISLNESLISLFLATPHNETLPAVVWPQLRYSANPLVAVASCVTSAIGILAAFFVSRLLGSRWLKSFSGSAQRR